MNRHRIKIYVMEVRTGNRILRRWRALSSSDCAEGRVVLLQAVRAMNTEAGREVARIKEVLL